MSWVTLILALVAAERLGELVLARANTKALMARGAVERGASHYPLIVALHAAWLIAIWFYAGAEPDWFWLSVYVVIEVLRIWTLTSLGRYWTTRIITLPGEQLVRRGPYRFIRHPNYAVVIAEIAVLPLVFHEIDVAIVFSLLNGAVLTWRIKVENETLDARAPT